VKLVGSTAQPHHEAVDAAIDELLDQEAGTHTLGLDVHPERVTRGRKRRRSFSSVRGLG
jgi:hypothetical protein